MKRLYMVAVMTAMLLSSCGSKSDGPMTKWTTEGSCSQEGDTITLSEGSVLTYNGKDSKSGYQNFELSGSLFTQPEGKAAMWFHSDSTGQGYEVLINNSAPDGTCKTGSLNGVRNLYKSMAKDQEWTPFTIAVRGKNIAISINGVDVVCYTEPTVPYRTTVNAKQILDRGNFIIKGTKGSVQFKDLHLKILDTEAHNINDTIAPIDEQNDAIIRLQQQNFPVIDYHVHLKGWTKEQAHARSMNYGINYGIAPNCGIGFPVTDDTGVMAYRDSTKHMPFFFGMQGEGREWPSTFSADSRQMFDYVFTDAMTFTDHKGRRTRLWINEEVFIDVPQEEYMNVIVDRAIKMLGEEPIDIYVNPFWVPEAMQPDYDKLWTPERIDKMVKAIKARGIALEINARYRVPNFETIRKAKEAGIKFAFGTNNGDPKIGKLEYCIEAIEACGLTVEDIWFPSDKTPK